MKVLTLDGLQKFKDILCLNLFNIVSYRVGDLDIAATNAEGTKGGTLNFGVKCPPHRERA